MPLQKSLDVRNIGVDAGGTALLTNVHFRLYPGELCALLGPSGAGKSTLIKVLLGISKAGSGLGFAAEPCVECRRTGRIRSAGRRLAPGTPRVSRTCLRRPIATAPDKREGEESSSGRNTFQRRSLGPAKPTHKTLIRRAAKARIGSLGALDQPEPAYSGRTHQWPGSRTGGAHDESLRRGSRAGSYRYRGYPRHGESELLPRVVAPGRRPPRICGRSHSRPQLLSGKSLRGAFPPAGGEYPRELEQRFLQSRPASEI